MTFFLGGGGSGVSLGQKRKPFSSFLSFYYECRVRHTTDFSFNKMGKIKDTMCNYCLESCINIKVIIVTDVKLCTFVFITVTVQLSNKHKHTHTHTQTQYHHNAYSTLEVHIYRVDLNVSRSVTTYLTLELTGTECSLKHGTTWYCVARPPCWIPFDDITLHLHQSKLHDIQNSQFAPRAKMIPFDYCSSTELGIARYE